MSYIEQKLKVEQTPEGLTHRIGIINKLKWLTVLEEMMDPEPLPVDRTEKGKQINRIRNRFDRMSTAHLPLELVVEYIDSNTDELVRVDTHVLWEREDYIG